jgi:hypothetical protein
LRSKALLLAYEFELKTPNERFHGTHGNRQKTEIKYYRKKFHDYGTRNGHWSLNA